MALEKLSIKIEKSTGLYEDEVKVLFNPNQLSYSRSGGQLNTHGQLIGSDDPTTLTVDLFFDTTIKDIDRGLGKQTTIVQALNPFGVYNYTPKNVEEFTAPIFNLTQKKGVFDPPRPPLCQIHWGKQGWFSKKLIFQGFLQQVTKTVTQFLEDGTPVRATLSCTFIEWEDPETTKKEINPIDDPIRIVKQGETLSSIAAEEYNNPALWRIIAETNNLNNPRKIKAGQSLTIPPLN